MNQELLVILVKYKSPVLICFLHNLEVGARNPYFSRNSPGKLNMQLECGDQSFEHLRKFSPWSHCSGYRDINEQAKYSTFGPLSLLEWSIDKSKCIYPQCQSLSPVSIPWDLTEQTESFFLMTSDLIHKRARMSSDPLTSPVHLWSSSARAVALGELWMSFELVWRVGEAEVIILILHPYITTSTSRLS